MKKLKYLLVICLFAIITTGCVKFNATMDIKKDKSMDFTIVYAFDKSVMGEMATLKEEDFDDLKKDGYTVEKYTEGNYEGFKIIKKINNIDEVSTDKDVEFNLSGMMEETEDNKYMFKVVKDGSKSTYYAKFKFDSNDSGLNDEDDNDNTNEGGQALPDVMEGEELEAPDENGTDFADEEMTTTDGSDIDLSGMMGSMDLSFNVNLPSKAISSNATTKENGDKKLSWKLNYSGSQTIEFAFEIDANAKDSNMLLYIGIGAGALILIIAVVAIVLSSKKKASAPKPVFEPISEPVAEPVSEPVAEAPVANEEPVAEPVSEPVSEPAPEQPEMPTEEENKE